MRTVVTYPPLAEVEATVSSKGQVTLPKALRDNLGIQTGSRIRFSLTSHGGFQGETVRYDLDDLWQMGPRSAGVMSFGEMDAAKARRVW